MEATGGAALLPGAAAASAEMVTAVVAEALPGNARGTNAVGANAVGANAVGANAVVKSLLRRLAGLVLGLLVLLLLEAAPAGANSGEEASAMGGPRLRLAAAGGASQDAVMLDSRLELRISGMLARATLEQRFRNPSSVWREAEYLLPLPADAAVHSMELQIGERRIVGEIREREVARQVYDTARRAGQRAALLEQQRPNLFTTRVANVGPQAEVLVRMELLVPVTYLDGQFSLRFPTTLTTRYMPGVPLRSAADSEVHDSVPEAAPGWMNLNGSGWAQATDQVADAPLLTGWQHPQAGNDSRPLNPLSLDIRLDAGLTLAEVGVLYHELRISRSGSEYHLRLRDGVVEMNRDVVLQWRPLASQMPQAALFRETFDGESFALLMLLPPQASNAPARLPRELLLVLDVSGSMQGEPIRQARASVLHALDTLHSGDRVNLILFNDGLRQLYAQSQPVTDALRQELRGVVSRIQAGGGTEMLPALRVALRSPPPEAPEGTVPFLRQLLFVTDGAVGNEEALLALIKAERGDARVYTVGIGSAPNGYFMRRAAQFGRGEALFIGNLSEVAAQLDGLFRRIATPMVRDLRVEWPAEVEAFPQPVPDLYAGQPLLQAVRLASEMDSGILRVSGYLSERAWTRELPAQAARPAAGVATHWARRKQAALLEGLLRGESRESVRNAVLPLALRFSLASPFTSFVAREQRPLRPERVPLRPSQVANTRPQGQAAQHFRFPQTATTAAAKLYFGLFCAFGALLGWVMTRREVE